LRFAIRVAIPDKLPFLTENEKIRNEVSIMVEIKDNLRFGSRSRPLKTEVRDNWTVALEYDGEGQGPGWLDLCHKTRWDLQSSNLGEMMPGDT
jgi:hypothetical protein